MSGDEINVVEITHEFIANVVTTLEKDPSEVGAAALAFFHSHKDSLVGLAAAPIVNILRNVGSGSKPELLRAKREFIATLPTTAMVNEYYEGSVQDLEAHVEEPLRVGGFLKALAEEGALYAPKILGVVAALAGL